MDSLVSESTVNGSPVTVISTKHAIRIIPKFVTPKKVIVNPYKESKNSKSPDIESKVEEISTKHAGTINSKFVTPQKALVNSHKTTKKSNSPNIESKVEEHVSDSHASPTTSYPNVHEQSSVSKSSCKDRDQSTYE